MQTKEIFICLRKNVADKAVWVSFKGNMTKWFVHKQNEWVEHETRRTQRKEIMLLDYKSSSSKKCWVTASVRSMTFIGS